MGEPTSAEMATMSYMQRVGTDTGSDGSSSILSHSFKKKTATPHLRILYFDNLRVIGHGKWCRWQAQTADLHYEGQRQRRLLHRLERARLHGGVGTHSGGDGYDFVHAEGWHGHRERRFQQYPVSQL